MKELDTYKTAKAELCMAFLLCKESFEEIWGRATEDEVRDAFDVISEIPIDFMIKLLTEMQWGRKINKRDVPQFSNFDVAVSRIPEILSFSDGETYRSIGFKLERYEDKDANIKYGENHAKLAMLAGLVINNNGLIENSSLGKFMLKVPKDERLLFIKKMLLRSIIVQEIISSAFREETYYWDLVKELSYSTAYRRRSNVRYLVEFVLKDTGYQNLLEHINWQVCTWDLEI